MAIAAADRARLAPLFAAHRRLRMVIDGVLEGRLGNAFADRREAPTCARLDLGCYAIFGGDSTAPGAAVLARIEGPKELIADPESGWPERLREIHGERLTDRPMRAYRGDRLDRDHLRRLATLPAELALRPLDAAAVTQLDSELEPHALQAFADPDAFLAEGRGVGVFEGDRLAAAATTYSVCTAGVEVAIATCPAFRRRGLASAAAAALLLDTLERGETPEWNASNPVSQHLALMLGFREVGICEVLYLT